jgi:hypothetical protein
MRLKKLGAALVAAAALGAIVASSASAAAMTEDVTWREGFEGTTPLGPKTTVKATQIETSTFATKVSGTEIVLHGTGVACVGCKIENSGGTAVGSGAMKFTGVTVEKPAKCTTTETIETKALSLQADWMGSFTEKIGKIEITEPTFFNYIKLVPTAGEEFGFATFSLTGAECPLKTTITPKGSVFVESVNSTGVQAAIQRVNSSGTINSTAGGSLHVGSEAATLTATVNLEAFNEKGVGIQFGTR